MKRAGFTMIELIFVIVILGILAAVAVPRLAATRDDARVTSQVANAAQAVKNLGAEYTAQGAFNNYTVAEAQESAACVTFTDNGDGNVTVAATVDDADQCPASIDDVVWDQLVENGILGGTVGAPADRDHIFGGASVVR